MDIYDQILENLELERELGTRMVEIDRALLVPPEPEPASPDPQPVAASPQSAPPPPRPAVAAPSASAPSAQPQTAVQDPSGICDIAFLTGRPLSAAGMEAMDKTFAAMRRIKPDIQVSINEQRKPRIVILLGSDALKKHLPGMRPMRGKWIELNGLPALMTFSPDFIFSHFQEGSPQMRQAKVDMWEDIKSAIARLPS